LSQFLNVHPAIVWVALTISTVSGILLGYYVSKYNKIVIGMILGGYMGYITGVILFNSVSVKIESSPTVNILYFNKF
jgi:hypothetical protein